MTVGVSIAMLTVSNSQHWVRFVFVSSFVLTDDATNRWHTTLCHYWFVPYKTNSLSCT